jgi:hypothetical protein
VPGFEGAAGDLAKGLSAKQTVDPFSFPEEKRLHL